MNATEQQASDWAKLSGYLAVEAAKMKQHLNDASVSHLRKQAAFARFRCNQMPMKRVTKENYHETSNQMPRLFHERLCRIRVLRSSRP